MTWVPNQYQCPFFEVEVFDLVLMSFFKMTNWLPACLQESLFCFSKVFWALLQLSCAICNEIGRWDGLGENRGQIGGLEEVKREKKLSFISQEIGWVPSRLLDRDLFSPKYRGCDHSPWRFFSITSFDEGFSDIEMALFNRTVGTRVVRWDIDMVYMVLLREVLNCLDKCRAIICDYLFNCTPTT